MRRNAEGTTDLGKKYTADLIEKPGYQQNPVLGGPATREHAEITENIVASSDDDEIIENPEKCAIGSYSATSVSSFNYVSIFTLGF